MVGRGWWLLVLTVCVSWMVCCVCGGLSCQQGQEFYNSQNGKCVPCTRCQHPLVVVVPCYVYQDAVCAPVVNFLPNLSQQYVEPEAPITLSTSLSPRSSNEDVLHQQERQASSDKDDKFNLSSGHQQVKDSSLFNKTRKVSSNDSVLLEGTKFRKPHSKHHHRHKHSGRHTNGRTHVDEVLPLTPLDPEVNGDRVSHRDGANKSVFGVNNISDRDSRFSSVNISDGANSLKDLDSDLQETESSSHWQNLFFLLTVVVLSVFVVVLICVILSQLRNALVHRKLKRVCDESPTEDSRNVAVMAQLLPAENGIVASQLNTNSTTRSYPISYTRCTSSRVPTTTASIPSSPAMGRGQVLSESEHISGQLYPPIPFHMDRLLEQRRVMGPSTSVDTNIYIESWQQADSQLPSHLTPSSSSVLAAPRVESASACPSPVPMRTYRLGSASASASPLIAVRGNGFRVPLQPLVSMPGEHPPDRSREVVLNST